MQDYSSSTQNVKLSGSRKRKSQFTSKYLQSNDVLTDSFISNANDFESDRLLAKKPCFMQSTTQDTIDRNDFNRGVLNKDEKNLFYSARDNSNSNEHYVN